MAFISSRISCSGNLEKVLEGEHQIPDRDRQLWLFALDVVQNLFRCRRIQSVHQIGDRTRSTHRPSSSDRPRISAADCRTVDTLAATSGENWPRFASRRTQSARTSGSIFISKAEACFGSRWLRISALVWECSPARNLASCCGSALLQRLRANHLVVALARQPLHHLLRAVLAKRLHQQANCDILAADCDELLRGHHLVVFLQNLQRRFQGHMTQVATSSVIRSRSSSGRLRRMGAAASSPRSESRMAALRVPVNAVSITLTRAPHAATPGPRAQYAPASA